jgi:hypothetical protein
MTRLSNSVELEIRVEIPAEIYIYEAVVGGCRHKPGEIALVPISGKHVTIW